MRSYRLIKPYLKEKRAVILLGLFALFVVDILQLVIPRIIKWAVDELTVKPAATGFVRYGLYIVGVALLIGGFRFIWRRCLIGTSRRVEEGLRERLFSHIQTLSAGYFDVTKTGDLMAHATNDIQHVRMAVGMGIVALTDAIVLGLAAVGFMLYINVRLTVFALLPMPLIAVLARLLTRRMHHLYKQVQGAFADLTEMAREGFAGIRVIKAYGREKAQSQRLEAVSREYLRKNLRLVRTTGAFFPGMLLFSNLSAALVLYLGGRQTIAFTITPGDFVAFMSYLALLTWPMMAMGWVMNLIQRGAASLDRINVILQRSPEIVTPDNPVPLAKLEGEIRFKDVSYRYRAGSVDALSRISFLVKPGQTLGIVGPTASGKTTLCHLISRLLDASAGHVLVDGHDVKDISLHLLRSHMAVAPQDAFVFSSSILDNLTFGKEGASLEEVKRAAVAADLYDTIMEFPEQFETVVGEKGVMLSGGQRQRLALARALLPSTPVVILDDPLSQVDTQTAATILKRVRASLAGRTTVLVSHRISHVRHADMIIVLDRGRIAELGVHEKLAGGSGYYGRTYRWQEIEESLEAPEVEAAPGGWS